MCVCVWGFNNVSCVLGRQLSNHIKVESQCTKLFWAPSTGYTVHSCRRFYKFQTNLLLQSLKFPDPVRKLKFSKMNVEGTIQMVTHATVSSPTNAVFKKIGERIRSGKKVKCFLKIYLFVRVYFFQIFCKYPERKHVCNIQQYTAKDFAKTFTMCSLNVKIINSNLKMT